MFTKCVIMFTILVLLVQLLDCRSTLHSENESNKKIKCFKPDKPNDMPHDVYEKYQISSKQLSEQDKKDFWNKFNKWWTNVFAQIGKFFERVGKFFKNLFAKKQNQREVTTVMPMTEPPPTPNPQKLRKDKNVLVCVEYEGDSNNMVTTKIYEVDVSTALTTDIEKLVTTTNQEVITIVATETTTTIPSTPTPSPESKPLPESTPFDPNSDHKNKAPVVIDGVENKAESKEKDKSEATIVRAV